MNRIIPSGLTRAYILVMSALALTGLAQMPIFKRYYIADIPGLAWTADYGFTHLAHYVLAALLLGWLSWLAARYLGQWSREYKFTALGGIKAWLMAGIVLTGILRVMKNQPDIFFSPTATMLIDWTHLGLVMLLGVAALVGMFRAGNNYLKKR